MASSYIEGKQYIVGWLEDIKPETVLDIGPGCGTYYFLCNGVYNAPNFKQYTGPKPLMVGIEVFYPYVEKYKLNDKYNDLIISDIRYFDWNGYEDKQFDLVFFGDVLEHLHMDHAIKVFERAKKKSKNVIISLPIVKFPQGTVDGNPFEAHLVDDWSHERVLKAFGEPYMFVTGQNIGTYCYKND